MKRALQILVQITVIAIFLPAVASPMTRTSLITVSTSCARSMSKQRRSG